MLFKIWKINIDYTLIVSFLIGLAIGLVLFGIVFFIIFLSSRRKFYVVKSKEDVKQEDVNCIKDNYISLYKERTANTEIIGEYFIPLQSILIDMLNDIAKLYFPKKKKALYEMSVDEMLVLVNDIADRVDDIITNFRFKGIFSKINVKEFINNHFTINDIVSWTSQKNDVVNPFQKEKGIWGKLVDNVKKKAMDVGAKFGISYLNKQHFFDNTCILIMEVTAQEAYQAFYKKVYKKETTINNDIRLNVEEIEE